MPRPFVFQAPTRLWHATEGWLATSAEFMLLHVNRTTRKVAPFPDTLIEAIAVMHSAHVGLPKPEALGRVIGLPDRSPSAKLGMH